MTEKEKERKSMLLQNLKKLLYVLKERKRYDYYSSVKEIEEEVIRLLNLVATKPIFKPKVKTIKEAEKQSGVKYITWHKKSKDWNVAIYLSRHDRLYLGASKDLEKAKEILNNYYERIGKN